MIRIYGHLQFDSISHANKRIGCRECISAADRRAVGIFEDNKTRVGDTTL